MLRSREAGETAFPDLATIMRAVKDVLRNRRIEEAATRERAADMREVELFDAYLAERTGDGESEESVLARFPSMAQRWRRWKGTEED
ncbi:MAG TPA: hypothetical protein VME18_02470 [Acidobacteriaceae bacterium]|nr:hypothetical protein [Acidobacteriaceae bacterium]